MTMKPWVAILAAVVVPGSAHVFLGRAARGLLLVCWMLFFAFLTWQLTTPNISIVGRLSGGIAVWVLSVLEAWRLARTPAKN